MGLLSFFSKPARPLLQLHSGSFSLDRGGRVLATTLPSSFPPALIVGDRPVRGGYLSRGADRAASA